MNKLKKTAKMVRKEIKNQVTTESIIQYLQNLGYAVIFYNENNEILKQHSLTEYAKTVNAFTLRSENLKAVFIKEDLSEEDMRYSILHETSHIVLGHLEKREVLRNKRKEEMDAEVLAYNILTPSKSSRFLLISILLVFCLIFTISIFTRPQSIPVSYSTLEEYVYITSSGSKYHRENCIHTQNKDCAKMSVKEAQKTYQPCKICNQ